MTLRAGQTRIRCHPLLLLMIPLAAALGLRTELWPLVVSLSFHEAAHLATARLLGVRVTELRLMPFGGAARLGNLYALSPGKLFAIAAAGPAVNLALLLGASAWAQWGWVGPWTALRWARVNLALMLFNLLPALPLDGGRMLYALTARRLGRDRAASLGISLGRALCAGLLVWTAMNGFARGRVNLSALGCAAFIWASAGEERQALTDLNAVTLLNALVRGDGPVPMAVCAVDAECTLMNALKHAAPDSATLYAVYCKQDRVAFLDERQLLMAAVENPDGSVAGCLHDNSRLRRSIV